MWDEILRHYLGEPRRRQQGLGSGVLVSTDGFIITNHHVIQGANEITVTLPESRQQYEAQLIAADPSTDVALLKIEGEEFPRAPLADSDNLQVGDVVLAVGNPFELNQTVTQGIVSALGRSNVGPSTNFYGNFIQTDASINPGNSGGPLVDSSGRVVGINSMIYSTTGSSTGIGFTIPINMALRVIGDLLDEGEVLRGYLGVELTPIDRRAAKILRRSDLSGALVRYVVPRSPAGRAGFEPGDLIVSYEGKPVIDDTKLRLAVSSTTPGTEVTFGVIREGREIDVSAVLGRLQNGQGAYVNKSRWDNRPPPPNQPVPVDDGEPLQVPFYLAGVELHTLDDSLRDQLGLADDYEGAVVIRVDPRSASGRSGLETGDVIVEVGRTSVRSTKEAMAAGQNLEGDKVMLGIIRDGEPQFVLVTK